MIIIFLIEILKSQIELVFYCIFQAVIDVRTLLEVAKHLMYLLWLRKKLFICIFCRLEKNKYWCLVCTIFSKVIEE